MIYDCPFARGYNRDKIKDMIHLPLTMVTANDPDKLITLLSFIARGLLFCFSPSNFACNSFFALIYLYLVLTF